LDISPTKNVTPVVIEAYAYVAEFRKQSDGVTMEMRYRRMSMPLLRACGTVFLGSAPKGFLAADSRLNPVAHARTYMREHVGDVTYQNEVILDFRLSTKTSNVLDEYTRAGAYYIVTTSKEKVSVLTKVAADLAQKFANINSDSRPTLEWIDSPVSIRSLIGTTAQEQVLTSPATQPIGDPVPVIEFVHRNLLPNMSVANIRLDQYLGAHSDFVFDQ